MFSLNITFSRVCRFYLINAHHAEIPVRGRLPQSAAMNMPAERYRAEECKQVVSLAYFHADGMDDGSKNACKNKCKNNVFCA